MTRETEPVTQSKTDNAGHAADTQKAAFLSMLQAQKGAMLKVVRMYCKHPDDQNELIQEITYRLWAGFAGFRGDSSQTTWVYKVALRTARMRHRARRDWIEFTDDISESVHPLTTDDTKEVNILLDIERLRDADKAILLLLLQGYQYNEVSSILEITPSVLRMRILRLRQRLKGKLTL